MKKCIKIVILTLVSCTLLFIGVVDSTAEANEQAVKVAVLNIERRAYPVDLAVDLSDLIVMISITDKASNVKNPYLSTVFNAEILKIYKGEKKLGNVKQINLIQSGIDVCRINGYPLFKKGEKAIVILEKAAGYENTYRIKLREINTYKILQVGEVNYVIKESVRDATLKDIDLSAKCCNKVAEELRQEGYDEDGIMSFKRSQIFELSKFESKLKSFINKKP